MPGRRRAPACLHGHVRWIDPAYQTVLDGVGLLPQVDWRTLAPGEAASVSRVTNCFRVRHPGGEVVYFKRYVYTRHKKFRHLLRPSRAMTEAFGYRQLAAIGIPTPEVVAFSEHRRLGRVLSTCIVVREVPASRDLERFAVEELRRMTQQGRREALEAVVSILAGQLRLAHAAGFFHQDLHWRNLLISGDTPDTYRIAWIDCPRARCRPVRRQYARLLDLSTLASQAPEHLTPRERFRALACLLGDRAPFAETRRWFRRIDRHRLGRRSSSKAALNATRGTAKPLQEVSLQAITSSSTTSEKIARPMSKPL